MNDDQQISNETFERLVGWSLLVLLVLAGIGVWTLLVVVAMSAPDRQYTQGVTPVFKDKVQKRTFKHSGIGRTHDTRVRPFRGCHPERNEGSR